ncbi:DUF5011 domain-containing protein [Erwinia sp. CPCC 100877]|nr:DUF5011 domain-containing protein [Erwinia sp. CPCC 100877]
MKMKTSRLLMLGLLAVQSLLPVSGVFAEDQGGTNQTVSSEQLENQKNDEFDTSSSQLPSTLETSQAEEANIGSDTQAANMQPAVVASRTATAKVPSVITDELLTSFTVSTIDGAEYSKTEVNRIKNATPVMALLTFYVGNPGYDAGAVYTFPLPDHLGYSDIGGKVKGVDADWSVDIANQTISITFNQRLSDVHFQLDLKSYIYSESTPLITVETPGQMKNTYAFDLYEDVEPIKYEETKNTYGLSGTVFYNLDRTLSGPQTLQLSLTEGNSAIFMKKDIQEISVYSYDVDVNGTILPETKQQLVNGVDYTLATNTVTNTSVAITDMNQQKAYGIVFDRVVALESVSDYTYSFYAQYPTTKLGSINLKRFSTEQGNLEFTAKTSQAQKMIKELNISYVSSGGFQAKGLYNLNIYSNFTLTKAGEKIIIESQNGQKMTMDNVYAYTPDNQTVQLADVFDIKEEDNKLVMTAKEDSFLRILLMLKQMDFEEKDITISLSTPVIDSGRSILMISDKYVQPISILNADNAETAWGNFDQNGFYMNRTVVDVVGSADNPIKNLEVLVKHPDYLTLRATEALTYYKLNEDYTITATPEGTVIKFTTPITREINFPLGFNYVPDGLAKTQRIPIDTIPVTLKADGYEAIETAVKTGSKPYSEATLQASKNQFLVNARNDSFDSLKVTTRVPAGVDTVFNIYDVSNDQVKSIYPQLWDRGTYFDHPIAPDSEDYPKITFDENSNSYQFDFGKTSKRYIIEYKYANGWIDSNKIYVTGSTAEPLNNNQELSNLVTLENEAVDILKVSQTSHDTLKNITVNQVETQNVDDKIRKIKNPVFEIKSKGTTNAGIDLNSITIADVPKDSYRLEPTANGVKIIFDDYTLTENISIQFNTISQNAGEISTETTIQSESLNDTSANRKNITSQPLVLKFSAGDAEGIVHLAKVDFRTYEASDASVPVGNIHFTLTDELTQFSTDFVTNEQGEYSLDGIMSGKYQLKVTEIPENYTIADEYLTGKEITINKDDNLVEIPLTFVDKTSINVKDSTIYVGDDWQPVDNFVSATDRQGHVLDLEAIEVTGKVDNQKAGKYQVTYKIKADVANPAARAVLAEQNETKAISAVATITVLDKTDNKVDPSKPDQNEPEPNEQSPIKPNKSDATKPNEGASFTKSKVETKTALKQRVFPQTGEKGGQRIVLLGIIVIVIGLGGFLVLKKKQKD